MADIAKFEENIGVEFRDKGILETALTHRSYLNENPSPKGEKREHNERLEFLGDAVLELVVTDYLYKTFPEKPEGDLTSLRASLVNANILGEVAGEYNFNNFLLLSRGETKDVGRARLYILANAFESVIGAIFLDQGYGVAQDFILRALVPKINKILEEKSYRDAKSFFQEEAQDKAGITPTYNVIKEWGPDHDKHFVVGVYLGKELVAEGEGPSKQQAQQKAAEIALKSKGWG